MLEAFTSFFSILGHTGIILWGCSLQTCGQICLKLMGLFFIFFNYTRNLGAFVIVLLGFSPGPQTCIHLFYSACNGNALSFFPLKPFFWGVGGGGGA